MYIYLALPNLHTNPISNPCHRSSPINVLPSTIAIISLPSGPKVKMYDPTLPTTNKPINPITGDSTTGSSTGLSNTIRRTDWYGWIANPAKVTVHTHPNHTNNEVSNIKFCF
ncbi:MAG: hypothetical protein V1487_04620 [bacterium]